MRHFLIYGDSVAAGYGAPRGQRFAEQLARMVSRDIGPIRMINRSAPGWNTLEVTRSISSSKAEIATAEFVCIFAGGDDLIQAAPRLVSQSAQITSRFIQDEQRRYLQMLALIRAHTKRPIVVGTLYNPYPNSPVAEKSISLFNSLVIQGAAIRTAARLAPVNSAFAGRQFQLIEGYSDGRLLDPGTRGIRFPIHPNALGHAVIAQAFYNVL